MKPHHTQWAPKPPSPFDGLIKRLEEQLAAPGTLAISLTREEAQLVADFLKGVD